MDYVEAIESDPELISLRRGRRPPLAPIYRYIESRLPGAIAELLNEAAAPRLAAHSMRACINYIEALCNTMSRDLEASEEQLRLFITLLKMALAAPRPIVLSGVSFPLCVVLSPLLHTLCADAAAAVVELQTLSYEICPHVANRMGELAPHRVALIKEFNHHRKVFRSQVAQQQLRGPQGDMRFRRLLRLHEARPTLRMQHERLRDGGEGAAAPHGDCEAVVTHSPRHARHPHVHVVDDADAGIDDVTPSDPVITAIEPEKAELQLMDELGKSSMPSSIHTAQRAYTLHDLRKSRRGEADQRRVKQVGRGAAASAAGKEEDNSKHTPRWQTPAPILF